MIPIVVPQDWDAIRERAPSDADSRTSASPRGCLSCPLRARGCASCLSGCASCARAGARATAAGCGGCASCTRRLARCGWRTWCLFAFNVLLILLVALNFGVTLWLMTVMKFTNTGMGQLKINPDGMRLDGKAYIMDSLVAASIASRDEEPITFESYDNFTIVAVDKGGNTENRLFIDADKFQSRAKNFIIQDDSGKVVFGSSPGEVTVGADRMRILGAGGAIFDHSVETPLISSESGQDLRIESLTRTLKIDGPKGISIQSSAGSIEATCLKDVEFKTRTGAIKLESSSIIMANLQTAQPSRYQSSEKTKIYQLCVCENGRLFLASPKGLCEIYDAEFLCRS